MGTVEKEMRGAVAVVTLSRPDALNALDSATLEALRDTCAEIDGDASAGAVVVTGAGRAFAAGADIAELREKDVVGGEAFSRLGHAAFAALEALRVPTIAAVNGVALGGGCELALGCDWIYASAKARFGLPEVKLGLIPGFGGTSRLPRRVGAAWAMELATSGEMIDAETALRIGLANRVFPPEELVSAAVAAAEAVAARGPLAVAAAKRVIREGRGADERVAHALEQAAFGGLFATQDAKEGLSAFLEKRDAEFGGR